MNTSCLTLVLAYDVYIPSLYRLYVSSLLFRLTVSLYHIGYTYGTVVYRTIPCLYYIIQYRHIYIVSQHAISYLYTVSIRIERYHHIFIVPHHAYATCILSLFGVLYTVSVPYLTISIMFRDN